MNLVYEIKYALENGFTTVEKLIERDGSIAYNGAFGYFVVTEKEAKEIDALVAQYVTTPEKAKEIDAMIAQYKPEEKPVSISPKLERLMESLAKAEAKVEKIHSTIERHHKQLKKKADALIALGYEIDYSNVKFDAQYSHQFKDQEAIKNLEKLKFVNGESVEHIWEIYDVIHKLEDIYGSHKKLEDAERIVSNWHVKVVAEQTRQDFASSAPKVIVDFVNEWGEYAFKWYMANLNHPNESRVKKMVENEKQIKIIRLTMDVTNIVGKITDARGLSIGEKGDLIGIIVGEKGSAKVETISAGGYNIQKFHFRTIINKI